MNFIAICLIAGIVLSQNTQARGITRLKAQEVRPVAKSKGGDNAILQRILQNQKKLEELMPARQIPPTVWEKRANILTGKTFRGVTLNAINSTNLASPIVVQAIPGQGLPTPTKFICQGTTAHKRVLSQCSLMISNEREIAINAQLLNFDGSAGLEGEYDSGNESLIAGAVLSDFSQGMLSAAQTRIAGPLGNLNDASVKNQLLQGGINSGRTTSEILLEEMKTQEPIVTVEAGIEVLVYFMEAVNEN